MIPAQELAEFLRARERFIVEDSVERWCQEIDDRVELHILWQKNGEAA